MHKLGKWKAKTLRTTVCGKSEAAQIIDSDRVKDYTHLVSIRSPGDTPLHNIDKFSKMTGGDSLSLIFDDVNHSLAATLAGYTPPDRNTVYALCHFFRGILDTTEHPVVLLHCAHGVSRSGAAAVILHYMHQRSWAITAAEVYREHRWVKPNATMISEASSILECGEDLLRAVARIADRRAHAEGLLKGLS